MLMLKQISMNLHFELNLLLAELIYSDACSENFGLCLSVLSFLIFFLASDFNLPSKIACYGNALWMSKCRRIKREAINY